MAHVEVRPGARVYVEEFGDGPPLVFVHGGGVTHGFWQHQAAGLMDRFRTITFDLRGCGESDKPPGDYTIDAWAEDLHVLIERLELSEPAVIGHAVGAHVAIRYAAMHREAPSRLVLASAAPWFLGERDREAGFPEELWQRMQEGWISDRPQSELDLADDRYFHDPPSEGMRLACLQMALTWPLPVYFHLIETLPQVDHRDVLPTLDLPVLVVHGRHDRKNRYEGGVVLSETLPDATLVTFEDSAHCPPLEEPERFNEVLADFLLETTKTETTVGSSG